MKKIISFIINKHLVIMRYLLVLATIVAITNLFPKNNFNYDFELNKPWKYSTLYSPFRFAIQLPADSIEARKDRIQEEFKPVYRWNEEVKDRVADKFLQNFKSTYYNILRADSTRGISLEDSVAYVDLSKELLEKTYEKGIIYLDDKHTSGDNAVRYVNVTVSNVGTGRNIDQFYSVPLAYKAITDTLRYLSDTTLLFLLPIFQDVLEANITFDRERSEKLLEEELNSVPETSGAVQQNEAIVSQGVKVDVETYRKLMSLKAIYDREQETGAAGKSFIDKYITNIGYFLITFVIFGVLVLFLLIFERPAFMHLRSLFFLLMAILLFLNLVKLAMNIQQTTLPNLSLYVLPFCIIPIIVKTFFSSRLAIFTYVVVIMITGFIVPLGYEFIFLHLAAGLVAIAANVRTYYWSQFFLSTALIFGTYCIGYLGLEFIEHNAIAHVKWSTYAWLGLNALLTLLAYPLIPAFEKLFGFVSGITLVEMGDVNKPLLKHLQNEAPGTFWHSLQVSNLAEAAASEIGANALLAKVGALYHDIGKMHRPAYFIENQKTGLNPHDGLPYEESAAIIIGHVTKGIEKAKKEGLPNLIIDFIRTHHGDTRTEYFYQCYIKENPNKEVDEALFRYPGPKPYSKETAIVMMADSVEAASKSLKNPTEEDINALVENIINGKIRQDQFVNCDLSFKDITTVKKIFKKQLKSLYHIRISYPRNEKKEKEVSV